MPGKNTEGQLCERTDKHSGSGKETDGPDVWTERDSDRQPDRQTETDRLSAPASASPVMSPWSCGTHVENPGMMQPSKNRSISGPACSHGANYDVE